MTVGSVSPRWVALEQPSVDASVVSISTTASRGYAGHIPALDGIRGLAIIGVLSAHLFGGEWRNIAPLDLLCRLLGMGWMGVDLFFVLSGFLITGILIDARNRPTYFKRFYGRRALRIFPLYYGILIVGLLVGQLGTGQIWFWSYLVNVRIAQANTMILPGTGWFQLAQFWSLAVEEHFYLIWPIIVYYCPPRWLLRVTIAIAVASCVGRSIFVLETGRTVASYVLTPFRVDGLLIGSACALALRSERGSRFLKSAAMPTLIGSTVLIFTTYLTAHWNQYSVIVATVGYAILSTAAASLVIVASTRPPSNRIRRVAESGILRFFGKYSYGIYAYHNTILGLLLAPVAQAILPFVHSQTAAALLAKGVALGAVILLAIASWHLYEKQWLKLKRHFDA